MHAVRRQLARLLAVPEVGIGLSLVALTALFAGRNPSLVSSEGVRTMLRALAFIGIVAVGQTLLMVAGELDLSVGSVAGLCAIVAAWLMRDRGWPVPAALLGGVLTGAAAGLINGGLAVRAGIPAFIATLGMLYIARGFNYLLCAGNPIYPLPPAVVQLGRGTPLGVSWAFLVFAGVALVAEVVLRQTVFGRAIYATGGNREVARIAGIHTDAVKMSCYVLTGALAAVAGILDMIQLNTGQPEIGTGWELDVIASVVIGGVSLFGGVGTVSGTVLGLLLMQVVRSGLVLSQVNTHWQTVAVGVIMIAAVGVDLLRRRAKRY